MKVPFSWYAMLSNIILSDRRDTFISDICQQKAEMGETFLINLQALKTNNIALLRCNPVGWSARDKLARGTKMPFNALKSKYSSKFHLTSANSHILIFWDFF